MALSAATWYLKLKGFLPAWFFEVEYYQKAHFLGMAGLFADLQTELDDHVTETFIASSTGDFLDMHGDERSLPRMSGEGDPSYSVRVRNLSNQSNGPTIKRIVDGLLAVGTCFISEDYANNVFLSREQFISRKELLLDRIMNAFSVVLERQIPDPSGEVYNIVGSTINRIKAFGCPYRVIVLTEDI